MLVQTFGEETTANLELISPFLRVRRLDAEPFQGPNPKASQAKRGKKR